MARSRDESPLAGEGDESAVEAQQRAEQDAERPATEREAATVDGETQTVESTVTTRDDATDLGVEMLPGDPSEPQGPEDALGPGPKRGNYRDRIGPPNYFPHVGGEPQRPHAENVGDEAGKKGGVETS